MAVDMNKIKKWIINSGSPLYLFEVLGTKKDGTPGSMMISAHTAAMAEFWTRMDGTVFVSSTKRMYAAESKCERVHLK